MIIRSVIKFCERIKYRWYILSGRLRARYYKYAFGSCGKNLKIYGKPKILSPERIFVGDNVTINENVQLCPRGKIVIADNVVMSRGAHINAGGLDTSHWLNEQYKERLHIQKDVYIGEGAWLCINSVILPGVSLLGQGIIVAAGAVVTKDVTEDYCVVAGVPGHITKKIRD